MSDPEKEDGPKTADIPEIPEEAQKFLSSILGHDRIGIMLSVGRESMQRMEAVRQSLGSPQMSSIIEKAFLMLEAVLQATAEAGATADQRTDLFIRVTDPADGSTRDVPVILPTKTP